MIRPAKSEDINSIHKLLKQISLLHYQLYPEYFNNDLPKYNHTEIEELINDSSKTVLVYKDAEVEGYLIGWNVNNAFFIDDICVDESTKGKGIGKELINSIKRFSKYKNIQLNVWLKNEPAINFYKKLGFETLKLVLSKEIND